MNTKVEQSSATNPNPVVSVGKDGTVLYSNTAGESLLNEWGVEVGERLPSYSGDLVQKVISRNNPEKIEVKIGKRVYLVAFHPSSEEECVNVYGFDISDQKELEGKLRESENKYRNIVETSVEGIWIFNAVSETTYVNEKMAEMLGYNREEIIGKFLWDFAYEEDKGIFHVKLANRKQGIDEVYELKLLRKDGSPLWVSVSAKGFFDDAGKFEGSVGMFTDITERKRAEQELRESEERFRSAFDDSAVAMALVGPDASLLKVNDAFCRLLGLEKSEMESLTFLDFTYPDDIGPSILAHKAVINRNKPFLWIEKRYIRKDGRVIWCEVSSSPVLDSKGCPIYTVAHVQDITERKEAEEALKKAHDTLEEKVKERTKELEEAYTSLKESEKSLAEAQRMAHIGNGCWDLVTGEIYWSDEIYRIFGLNPQESTPVYGKLLNYVHPDDRDYVDKAFQRGLKGEPFGIDHRIILNDGRERIVHTQIEVILDEKNNPVRMKGTVQDITERKKAEEALAKIETARKKEIHHRIKNNLQVISSLLDLQAEKFKNIGYIQDLEVLEAFRESQDRVRSMSLIHEELYKGGGVDTFDFSSYIKELTENLFLTYRLGNTDISLNLDLEENLFFDMDIATPMGLIINELVSNSLKHAFSGRDKGEIRIKLCHEKTEGCTNSIEGNKSEGCKSTSFVLTVSDNGVGIPENIDIKNTDTLGLQLVVSLVNQLDGELELKRNNGTEFTMKFKVIEKNDKASASAQTSPKII